MRSVDQCKEILECAIGEVDYAIPSDVLEDTIKYLEELDRLQLEISWMKYPESMGR